MIKKIKNEIKLLIMAGKADGNIRRKLKYLSFARMAQKNGVIDFRIDRIATEYTADYFDYEYATKEEKEWAYPKGIASYKIRYYGMNKENYKDYISDFDFYHKRNYMNRAHESWFENKLNTYYLLHPFESYMPEHYWYITNGQVIPIGGRYPKNGSIEDIFELIEKKPIAAKATYGGLGKGFYKLEKKGNDFFANFEKKTRDEFLGIIKGLNNYIITEYVYPGAFYQKLCGADAFAVIRIIMVYDENDGPQMTGSIIRLGCKAAGVVTERPGTIYCGLTLEEGKSFNGIYRVRNDYYQPCPVHPDTGMELNGFTVPKWDELKELVKQISAYIPMTPYLVMDIIPTEDSFSVLEINSHGQVRMTEPFYPFLKNKYNRKVFDISEYKE